MIKVSPFVIMFWIFFTLKLTGHITWSWVWVTAPVWVPFANGILFLIVYFIYSKFKSKQ